MPLDPSEHLRLAREASARIQRYMTSHDVMFNGVGEERLEHGTVGIAQAWNVDHLDEHQRKSNHEILREIANILKQYRQVRCEIHGETGAAKAAPKPLARHLKLREVEDVAQCMNVLAQRRAEACFAALVEKGVPPRQLFVSATGMGGQTAVHFRPDGTLPIEDPPEPLPMAPPELKLHREYRRTTLVREGPRHLPPRHAPGLRNRIVPWAARDLAAAVKKFPRLDTKDALRDWLVHTSRRAGGGADFAPFVRLFCAAPPPGGPGKAYRGEAPTTLADLLHFDCARISKLGVCSPATARALASELESLRRVVTADERRSGNDNGLRGTLMPQWLFAIIGGRDSDHLRVHAPEGGEAGDNDADPAARGPWYSGMMRWPQDKSLPHWGDFRNPSVHGDFGCGCGCHDCHRLPHAKPSRVDVQLRPPPAHAPIAWPALKDSDPNALREARSRIRELLDNPIIFNGAGDDSLESIAQAWSVDHTDASTRFQNLETLSGIADVLLEFGEITCEVHGETGLVNSAPPRLAEYLYLDPVKDVDQIMYTLAKLRAEACRDALVEFGVEERQLRVRATGQGGRIQVDFLPDGVVNRTLRFGHVPLRFVNASTLDLASWQTLHLGLNCHFDPLPSTTCAHAAPCSHRIPRHCDNPHKCSVRSWGGKAEDYALSTPAVPAGGGPPADGVAALLDGGTGGPRGAYHDGIQSAFYSSTRTPNPHVGGDGRLGPHGWKTALLWQEVRLHAANGILLWCDCACLDQVAISRGLGSASRYAESILASMEECGMLWVHTSSDYADSIFTVLELLAWHTLKGIHPSNTRHLNAMAVTSVAGRATRVPLYDRARDHVAWLRGQLRKHGSVGREVAMSFRMLAGVDVRDEAAVRGALDALAALSATPPAAPVTIADPAPHPAWLEPTLQRVGPAQNMPTWYSPNAKVRGAPEKADFDYGFIEPPGEGGSAHPPRHFVGGHPPYSGRPPDSLHHPPARPQWRKPGLHSDLPVASLGERGGVGD